MSPLASQLLLILSDGALHKGQNLADHLGVTRQGVWKAIKELKDDTGLSIGTIGKSGYQLETPFIPLNDQVIRTTLAQDLQEYFTSCRVLQITESTNDDAKDLSNDGVGAVFAEMQTNGRGRSGKRWHAPFGSSLITSFKLPFKNQTMANLTALSPSIGILIADVLAGYDIAAKVKWPNDIWVDQHKIAGILIEVTAEIEGIINIVIGIGINTARCDRSAVEQKHTDCESLITYSQYDAKPFDRNILAVQILNKLIPLYRRIEASGVPEIAHIWPYYSALIDQRVRLFSSHFEKYGIERGINEQGALLIELESSNDDSVVGEIKPFFAGELSLRPVDEPKPIIHDAASLVDIHSHAIEDSAEITSKILLLDFGNTSLKWAFLKDGNILRPKFGVNNESIPDFIKTLDNFAFENVSSILITSVINPVHLDNHLFNIKQILSCPQFIAKSLSHLSGLTNGYMQTNRLGVDRWLGMLGAWIQHSDVSPILVIDIGTALTMDLIDEKGGHLGGVIQPGMRLMRESLFKNTAAVMVDDITLLDTLGTNTKTGVGGGLYHAIVGACVSVIMDAKLKFPKLTVYVSGGNGLWLRNEITKRVHNTPIVFSKNLVFKGLIEQAESSGFI